MRASDQYMNIVTKTLERAWETQKGAVTEAASILAKALVEGHSAFIFGCSHAGILAEEAFYRTGGLAVINPIFFPGFMLNTKPITMTSQLERVDGIGRVLADQNRIAEGDVVFIHSVSGRNNVPVEFAMEVKKRGGIPIAITNVAYSQAVSSRHPSGKHLYEVCDLVIDNCGDPGDAAASVEGLPEKIGPTSTAVGAALLNALIVETVEQMIAMSQVPPVFLSANLDGGDEHNRLIFEKYKDQIRYQ